MQAMGKTVDYHFEQDISGYNLLTQAGIVPINPLFFINIKLHIVMRLW